MAAEFPFTVRPACEMAVFPSGVIGISIRIHDPPNRAVGQTPDRGDHLLARCRDARVHDENAIVTHLNGDIGAGANEHVNVPLHVEGLDVALILLGSRRMAPQRDRDTCARENSRTSEAWYDRHFAVTGVIVFSFVMYSGYIVSAPPRVGSSGSA